MNVGGGSSYFSGSLISHNCSFLSTAYTLIRPQTLQSLKPIKPIFESADGYREYATPDPTHVYVMFVDTAEGSGKDDSAFVVVDVTQMPYITVASFANNRTSTMDFPKVIVEYAERWYQPWMLVEVMDIGRDVANILVRDYEYPRFMSSVVEKRLGQRLTFNSRKNMYPGLRMTSGVKRSGCATIKPLIENGQLIITDYRILQQLSTFVQRGSSYSAETGHHDDLVMPLVMLGWAAIQPNFSEVTNASIAEVYKGHTEAAKTTSDNPDPIRPLAEVAPVAIGLLASLESEDDDGSWLLIG